MVLNVGWINLTIVLAIAHLACCHSKLQTQSCDATIVEGTIIILFFIKWLRDAIIDECSALVNIILKMIDYGSNFAKAIQAGLLNNVASFISNIIWACSAISYYYYIDSFRLSSSFIKNDHSNRFRCPIKMINHVRPTYLLYEQSFQFPSFNWVIHNGLAPNSHCVG